MLPSSTKEKVKSKLTNIGHVLDVFVSEDRGLLRIDVEVSSPLHAAARIRKGRGVTQMGTSTAVAHAHAQPEDLDLRSGIPMFMLKSDSASPGIGDRLLPSHHQCSRTDTAKPREIHMGERRLLRKKLARAQAELQTHHDHPQIRATFPRRSRRLSMVFSHTESSGKVPKHRPDVQRRTVVGTVQVAI